MLPKARFWTPGMPWEQVVRDSVSIDPKSGRRLLEAYSTGSLTALIDEATRFVSRYQYIDEYDDWVFEETARILEIARPIVGSRRASTNITVINHSRPVESVYLPSREPQNVYEQSPHSHPYYKHDYPSVEYAPLHALEEGTGTECDSDNLINSGEEEDNGPTKRSSQRRPELDGARHPHREKEMRKTKRRESQREVESAHESRRRHTKSRQHGRDEGGDEKKGRRSKRNRNDRQRRRDEDQSRKEHDEPEDEEQPDRGKHKKKTNRPEKNRRNSAAEVDDDHNPSHRNTRHDDSADRSRGKGKGKSRAEREHGASECEKSRPRRRSEGTNKSGRGSNKRQEVSPPPERRKSKLSQTNSRRRQSPEPQQSQNHESQHGPEGSSLFNPYEALGIEPGAPEETIKIVCNVLSKRFHPDRLFGKPEAEVRKANDRMAEVNKAKDLLMDTDRRVAYDAEGIVSDLDFQEWLERQQELIGAGGC